MHSYETTDWRRVDQGALFDRWRFLAGSNMVPAEIVFLQEPALKVVAWVKLKAKVQWTVLITIYETAIETTLRRADCATIEFLVNMAGHDSQTDFKVDPKLRIQAREKREVRRFLH